MKTNDGFINHPEIAEFIHICAVSPDAEDTKMICDLIKGISFNQEGATKRSSKQIKREKDLDAELEDTFPASDAVAHY